MKHFKTVFNALKGLLLTAVVSFAAPISAEEVDFHVMDSVEISLLTCQPHDEVYSLYGHTAIRYHDLRKGGLDVAFNYGVFDYKKPYFALRFVFGLTDYELGCFPYKLFKEEYKYFGSKVTEQVLNLTSKEKMSLRLALAENLLPENTVYRYNYFYNNCTTKARDIIEQCVNGKVEYTGREGYTPTYRSIVHDMTKDNLWSRFGNDLLLGIKADQSINLRQQEFLPNNLMYDFDHANIHADDGSIRPLIKECRTAVPAGVQIVKSGFPLSPTAIAIIISVIGIIIFILEFKKRHAFLLWDIVLMLITGTIGCVLFLMLFSQHPTVSLNLQFLLFNPLPFCFLWPVIRQRGRCYWQMTAVLTFLFAICGFFQHYAEGIWCLAFCLLLQSYIHIKR